MQNSLPSARTGGLSSQGLRDGPTPTVLIIMFDLEYETIVMIIAAGLLFSVFLLPDLVAVVIIVATLAGLALNTLQDPTPSPQEQMWRQGENWWRWR